MGSVTRTADGFVVDAALLAEAFAEDQASIRAGMRSGRISTKSETGVGDDAGRHRLIFRSGDRVVRFTVDDTGRILSRACFDAPSPFGTTG